VETGKTCEDGFVLCNDYTCIKGEVCPLREWKYIDDDSQTKVSIEAEDYKKNAAFSVAPTFDRFGTPCVSPKRENHYNNYYHLMKDYKLEKAGCGKFGSDDTYSTKASVQSEWNWYNVDNTKAMDTRLELPGY